MGPENNIEPISKPRSKSNRAELYQTRSLARQKNGKPPRLTKISKKSGFYDLWDENDRKDTLELSCPKLSDGNGIGHGVKRYTKDSIKMTSKNFGTDLENKNEKIRYIEESPNLAENEAKSLNAIKINKKHKTKFNIELPAPGQSYKPDYVQHQNLLRAEHDKILKEESKLEKIDRQVAWDKNNAATYETDLAEKCQGLFEEEEEWEDVTKKDAEEPEDLEET